jgi:LPS-assembly lipoprotein
MLWPRLLLVAVLAGLGPAGCGFHAVHATNGDSGAVGLDLARVRVDPIADRLGQQVRNALIERLSPRGEPADPAYTLKITLTESATDLGYRKDNLATLGNLTVTATVRLYHDSRSLLTDTASTVVSFDYLGPRYASVVMERDARDRAAIQIADDIRGRVAAAIERYKANPNAPRYRRQDDTIVPLAPPTTRP